jgi:sugar (pentulose or hexulose) kinase
LLTPLSSSFFCVQEKFSEQELVALSKEIDPSADSPFRYYPLPAGKVGERFPVNDPQKEPVVDPKPVGADGAVCRRRHLHGLLQGIAEVERAGYQALADLGATPVTEVLTAGGGAANDMWTRLRQRLLGVPTSRAGNADAAYGCARLAGKYHAAGEEGGR